MNSTEISRKENYELSKNLSAENDLIFTDIVCYLRVSDIGEEDQEEIISDILRMFLDWQEEGKSVESMIGENFKKFADNIILAVNPKRSILKKVKEYLDILIEGFCILLTIDFVFSYLPRMVKGNLYLSYEFTAGWLMGVLIIVAVASLLVNYICKNSFELSKKRHSKLENFIFGCSFAIFNIFLVLISILLKDVVIASINIFYVIGIIMVYWIYKGVKKIKIKPTV